jgi:enediyne biosynthesis protein E4
MRAPVFVAAISLSMAAAAAQTPPGGAPFVDRTTETGLGFVHANGARGQLLLPEVIGAGGALLDYDNDGDLDVFAVQSAADAPLPAARGSRLYRNELRPGGRLRFVDVTEQSRIALTTYGMGAATGDVDNDGWTDLYVTALGSNALLRNNGNGTFTDITTASGTTDRRWSTSASFLDVDRDGWLDLFVANYVNFRADMKRECFSAASARDYCNPVVYDAVPARLLRNARNGTFADISTPAGIATAPGRGLGVLAFDANEDGWTDIYVANDGDPNHLWINERGAGRFRDEALLAGVALSRAGRPQGSMGIDAADLDGDGDEELFVTNLDNEGNALYVNGGKGLFEERTLEWGLFALGFTGFGTRFVDYDNDTWPDVIVVNGAVRHMDAQRRNGDAYPLKQRNQLFHNERGRRYAEVTAAKAPVFAATAVGRGLATGDLDNDGDADLIAFNNSGPARVLLNESARTNHWLGLRILDGRSPRDALQARAEVTLADGRRLVRRVHTDGSYASAGDPRVLFGLGTAGAPVTVRVLWPQGSSEEFRDLATDRYWTIEPGKPPRAM